MRVIKFLLIGGIALFLVGTALSLLFPSELRVARTINVPAADRDKTIQAISDFRAWREWNQFLRSGALNNIAFSTPSAGKGSWLHSDELQVHETQTDSNGVLLHWDLKGGKSYEGGYQFMDVNNDSVAVEWWFDLHFRWYPWEKLGVFVYDRKLGPVMEESLDQLRQFVEKTP